MNYDCEKCLYKNVCIGCMGIAIDCKFYMPIFKEELLRVAEALECSASADSVCKGSKCPYLKKEELDEEYRQKLLDDGMDPEEWTVCDVDGIALGAARILREIAGGIE